MQTQVDKFLAIMEAHKASPYSLRSTQDGSFVWKPSEESSIAFYGGKAFLLVFNGEPLKLPRITLNTIVSFALKHVRVNP